MVKVKTATEALLSLKEKFQSGSQRPGIKNYKPYIDESTGQSPQRDFHSSPAQGRLFVGGNRSGKTVGGATESAMWLTGQHSYRQIPKPPIRGRAIGVDFNNGIEKIIKPEIVKWIPPSFLINGSWEDSYSKEYKTLTLNNGSFLEFMSYDQDVDAHAGTSRHFIWFDEEPPEAIYDENMQRLVDTAGHWWMTMTPVEGMTWVFEEIYEPGLSDSLGSGIFVIEVDTTMNPYIDHESREILLQALTAEEKLARTQGKFIGRGGVIYPMFNRNLHVIDPVVPDKNELWVAGMDHGFNNPTCWLWASISRDGRIVVFDEHYQAGMIVREHARIVHARNALYSRVPNYYVGDPSIRNKEAVTGSSVLIEYDELGIPIILGNNDVMAGINRVARLLTGIQDQDGVAVPSLYFTENCPNAIKEMVRLRWATWANKKEEKKKNKKEEQHKKDDHAADTVRYIVNSRPELDTGTEVPDDYYPGGLQASRAIDPNVPFRDLAFEPKPFRHPDYNDQVDEMMGAEW